MLKVGILRGPGLNPYEGQYLEKLPKFGFQPIGITTYDHVVDLSEIHFPVRVGNNFKTLTHGKIRPLLSAVGKVTKYNFTSWNLKVYNLKKLTSDLDIIYSADMWYPYTYQAVKTGIPTIVMEWENIPFNVEGRPYSKIKKYNRENAAHFVAITQKAKEALITEGVQADRITVIPAGLDCETFKPTEKDQHFAKTLNLSPDSIRILFVGRLVPEKGIFDLLEAFSTLLQSTQKVELMVVGSGTPSMQAQINKLIADLKIGDKVKFLGSIPYSNMAQIHNLVDIFCLPSVPTKIWAEQFGYSLVEAMACGKPVVSTFSGSIPEVVKDRSTGILVQPNDRTGLKNALQELILDKQERETFGRNAREWALQQFEANKVAEQLAKVYSKYV